jgi:hypothetical protein
MVFGGDVAHVARAIIFFISVIKIN